MEEGIGDRGCSAEDGLEIVAVVLSGKSYWGGLVGSLMSERLNFCVVRIFCFFHSLLEAGLLN